MERFTRTIPVALHLLATPPRVDRIGNSRTGLAATAATVGSAKAAALVAGDGGRHVCPRKKRGADVGKTKRGKGTKILLMVDGRGLPISAFVESAQTAEVHTVETLVDVQVGGPRPQRLIYDKAADADWLRERLAERGIELICPHRSNRKRPSRQDGRALRRYRHRWIVERTISWLFHSRRLLVRHEYYPHLFQGFVTLACLLIVLNRF